MLLTNLIFPSFQNTYFMYFVQHLNVLTTEMFWKICWARNSLYSKKKSFVVKSHKVKALCLWSIRAMGIKEFGPWHGKTSVSHWVKTSILVQKLSSWTISHFKLAMSTFFLDEKMYFAPVWPICVLSKLQHTQSILQILNTERHVSSKYSFLLTN